MNIFCKIGLHHWYKGLFGEFWRYERHCLDCDKKQFSEYDYKNKERWYTFLQAPPRNGDRIKLTWLPNPTNAPDEKSIYIGSTGIVEDVARDGSFNLNMGGGILIVGTRTRGNQYRAYTYELLELAPKVPAK